EASAEHREVLREEEDEAAVDRPVAGDDAVAVDLPLLHPEVGAAVDLEAVELDEAPRIDELLDALARGELAVGVLALDALLAAAEHRLAVPPLELGAILLDCHEVGFRGRSAVCSMCSSEIQGSRTATISTRSPALIPRRAAQPPGTSSTKRDGCPTPTAAVESGVASAATPTIRPSAAMKIMSSGISVFFIQNS